uniref:Ankyrin repeat-containing protein n=1 Tax=Quercus lobata TaxID=97700 RepID=A0A7N2LRK5_QUELO
MVNTYTNMTKPLFWKPSNTSSPSLYVPLVLQTLQLIASPLKNDAAKDDELNGELYNAILNEEVENVIKLCERFTDHAMHRLNIHKDTVLHVATYSKQTDLVLGLLEAFPHHHIHKMTTSKNVSGNTVLHEVATLDDGFVEVATKMLENAEGLSMRNELGESVLFQAARYGKINIFNFLAD